jgi:hypothetical protein
LGLLGSRSGFDFDFWDCAREISPWFLHFPRIPF